MTTITDNLPPTLPDKAGNKSAAVENGHLRTVAIRAYSDQKPPAPNNELNELIEKYLPLVSNIAHRTATYIRPPLSFDDLIAAGTVGLLKAVRDFDPSHKAEFKTYAYIKIKGAILDELRRCSFLPATVNSKLRKLTEAGRKITGSTGRAPTAEQLAEKLNISTEQVYELLSISRTQQFISMTNSEDEQSPCPANYLASTETANPYTQIEQAELTDKLAEAIGLLEHKQKQIIILYYQQNLTMKQIAEVLDITESRVSQLHSSAVFNLSVQLKEWKDG